MSETGAKKDEPWPKRHYFRGLDDEIRKGIAPSIATAKDVDGLATMAQNMANALELSGPKQTRTREESKGPIDTGHRSQSSSTGKKYPPKLSTRERTTLIANDGCFACRKINAGHVANDCPEFKDQKDNSKVKKESMVKEESVNDMSVVESESESPYSSVPVITVPAEVQGASVTALADGGASINVLSTDTVQRQRLRTQRTNPVEQTMDRGHENIKTSPAHLIKARDPIGIEIIQFDLRTKHLRADSTTSNWTLWTEQVSPSIRKEI